MTHGEGGRRNSPNAEWSLLPLGSPRSYRGESEQDRAFPSFTVNSILQVRTEEEGAGPNEGRSADGPVEQGAGQAWEGGWGQEKAIYSFIQGRFVYTYSLPSPVLAGSWGQNGDQDSPGPALTELTVNE